MSEVEQPSEKKPTEWPEIKIALETKRYELTLVGAEISKRIEDNGGYLSNDLFKLKNINLLEVAKTSLKLIPKRISELENLTTIIFHTNALKEIPIEIHKLVHLIHIDFSNNQITQLPEEMKSLVELKTLNISGNCLKDLFPLENLTKLAVINLSRNKFVKLPQDLGGSSNLENLSEIDASFNEIAELSDELAELTQLKKFNLEHNQITQVPSNLSQISKLKDLLLKDNKLKDNRLKKLIEQDKLKAVLDYLEKQYVEECKKAPKIPKEKVNKSKTKAQNEIIKYDLVNVISHQSNDEKLKANEVHIDDSVLEIRPFIVCCIVRNLNLKTPGNLKKFLNLQTTLHEDTCQKRTLATIATHDLSAIKGNISYKALDAESIEFTPLGRNALVNASEFYQKLMEEAEAERKAKKRNQLSGIYKYLSLLENKKKFPVVQSAEDKVISLPPLTNSENTRMSMETTDILIEITSTNSLETCKKVMQVLIVEMLNNNLCLHETKNDVKDLVDGTKSLQLNATQTDDSNVQIKQTMTIQQVRILDSKAALKCVYPSRIDLNFEDNNKIKVARLYDE